MRKILMATTALVGVAFASSAQAAATSPISLNVGGYDDFVAGFYHSGNPGYNSTTHDFENEFKLNFDALGKSSTGVEYGANLSLWNGAEVGNLWQGGGNSLVVNTAYVWLSGAFGKVLFGDEHGASDLFTYAPTVGEGQVDGRYRDFVDTTRLAYFQASGLDNSEHSTKITYYTPKVGNETNKVQLGVSYAPNLYDYGQNGVKYTAENSGVASNIANTGLKTSAYQDIVKAAAQYTGDFRPVNVVFSGQIISGQGSHIEESQTTLGSGLSSSTLAGGKAQDFVAWGLGGQVGYNGLTFGASYTDLGSYNTVLGQGQDQDVWSVGAKYEFDKVAVAANWLNGEGYANYLTNGATASNNQTNYVSAFNAYGAGASYTWFPGLTSNLDGVFFDQKVQNQATKDSGYVLLVSQRLAF